MDGSPDSRSRTLDTRTKIYFASGSLAVALAGAAGATTLLYYNQVLGVSPELCGIAFLIASVADAVTDPLVGSLSDGWKSRWGRRHPFMFASALPFAATLYFTYQPPTDWPELGLFAWLTTLLVLSRTAATLFVVPHNAMGAEMTDDYHERTSIFGFNYFLTYIGGFVFGQVLLLAIFPTTPEYPNGMLNPDRYVYLSALCAVVAPITILYCTWVTRDQIPHLHGSDASPSRARVSDYLKDIWQLLHNQSYLVMSICWLILATTGGILGVVFTYSYVYGFELSTEEMAILRYAAIPGFLAMLPFSTWLTKRLDKKYALILTGWSSLFFIGLPIVLRMLGLFPENDSQWLIPSFFAIAIMTGIITPVVPITVDSMMTDVADEHELRTGQRSEGAIFAVKAFAMKLTQGLGGMVAGFGLAVIGFPENAVPGEVEPEVITRLFFLNGPLYWMICGVGYCFLFFYTLTRERHEEILKVLAEKRRPVSDCAARQ